MEGAERGQLWSTARSPASHSIGRQKGQAASLLSRSHDARCRQRKRNPTSRGTVVTSAFSSIEQSRVKPRSHGEPSCQALPRLTRAVISDNRVLLPNPWWLHESAAPVCQVTADPNLLTCVVNYLRTRFSVREGIGTLRSRGLSIAGYRPDASGSRTLHSHASRCACSELKFCSSPSSDDFRV